jgi:hypothetical protein
MCAAARYGETVMPLDEFLPALYTTHPRADVTHQLADRVRPELPRAPAEPYRSDPHAVVTADEMHNANDGPTAQRHSVQNHSRPEHGEPAFTCDVRVHAAATQERLVALAWSGEGERELVTQYEVGQVTIVGSDTEDSGDMEVVDGCIVRVSQSARVGLRDELASIRSRASNPVARFAQAQRLRQEEEEEANGRL